MTNLQHKCPIPTCFGLVCPRGGAGGAEPPRVIPDKNVMTYTIATTYQATHLSNVASSRNPWRWPYADKLFPPLREAFAVHNLNLVARARQLES